MKIEFKFIGQCGFIISAGNLILAVDPVLNDLIENGKSIRNYPAVMKPENLHADYIFCTHDHIDHLACETVKIAAEIDSKTRFIVPKGCERILWNLGIEKQRVLGVASHQTLDLGNFSVTGISAAHPKHQVDENGLDRNLAYSIVLEKFRIVHLGDTYSTKQLEQDLLQLGKINLIMAPINGMDEQKAAAGIIGNMNAQEAAALCRKIAPEIAVPTHFDMVIGNTADPEIFVQEIKRICPETKVIVPSLDKPVVVETMNPELFRKL